MILKFFKKNRDSKTAKNILPAAIEDEALWYCPRCNCEYRQGVANCVDCLVPLISAAERRDAEKQHFLLRQRRSTPIVSGEEVVTIRKGGLHEIKQLQNLLAGEGVPASLLNEAGSHCGKGCCGVELCLQIRPADLALANEILARDFARSTALGSHDLSVAAAVIDLDGAKATCPACGHGFVPGNDGICPECGLCFL